MDVAPHPAAGWRTRRALPVLLATQLASTVGSSTTGMAIALWLYAQSGSVTWLGVLFAATTLPGAVIGPWAGTIVDRYPRRHVMLVADAAAGLATLGLIAAVAAGLSVPALFVVAAFTISFAEAFQVPAYGAAVASLAPSDRLDRVNGIVQLGPAIGTVAGPALAVGLLALGGIGLVLAVDLATFTLATAALFAVRFAGDRGAMPDAPRGRAALREGWKMLAGSPGLRALSGTAAVLNLLFGFVNVLLIPLVVGFADEASAGIVLSIVGAGMVVGSLGRAAVPAAVRPSRVIAGSVLSIGVGVLIVAARPSVLVVAAGAALFAIPVPIVGATARSVLQRAVPGAALGRVLALQRALITCALPLAHLSAGPLTDRVFEPAMASGGLLAASIGALVGTGAGRGAAALFVLCGLGIVLLGLRLGSHAELRALADGHQRPPAARALAGRPAT